MNKRPHQPSLLKSESGQAAALVALLLFLAFLAFGALAIDGAMTYLVRRDLQNVADSAALAACRVLAYNDTTTTPLAAAENSVTSHLGSWQPYVGDNPPATNAGAGTGLLKGIEIGSPDVRVALQRRVPTVLTQFVGRGDSIMVATAHCGSTSGGGLMPIAVQRYDGDSGSMLDYVARSGAPPYPSDSVTVTIPSPPARYPPSFQVPVPCGNPGAPACLPATDYTASDASPGPEVVLLGQQAETNNGVSSMRDLVLLDIRNVANQLALEYYNGADSQADAAKNMSQNWIYQHGYPGPYPQVGSQAAILDGASVPFAAGAMTYAGYQVGDVVAAIVYDGFVWSAPDFGATLTPANTVNGIAAAQPVDTNTARSYTLNIGCPPPCATPWFRNLNFTIAFDFTNKPGGSIPAGMQMDLDGVPVTPGVAYTLPSSVPQSGSNFTLRVWNPITTTPPYLSGINVTVVSDLGVTHGASSNFGFGPVGPYNFTLRSNHGLLIVHQGDNSGVNPITYGAGALIPNGQGCRNTPLSAQILLGGAPQPWATYFSSASSVNVNIPRNNNNTYNQLNFPLVVQAAAPIGNNYTLRLTVGGPTSNCGVIPQYTEDIAVEIRLPQPGGTPNKFVFIQGYALFRITRFDPPNSGNPNTVFATAISPLYTDYSDITVGLRPRLIPW